ncbi:MAG: hypothetical protein ACE5J3_12960 [Methanosarcinales archaeon]
MPQKLGLVARSDREIIDIYLQKLDTLAFKVQILLTVINPKVYIVGVINKNL